VKDYYEELWSRLPDELTPPDLSLRSAFLRENVNAGDRLLDLGCGDGAFTAIAAACAAEPIGMEVAEAAVNRARDRHPELDFRLIPIDGPLPIHAGAFEVVWSSEVIEHVADTARWLSEIRRVLVPGGRLLLTTPSHGRARLALGGIERYSPPQGDHLHLYSRTSLSTLLEDFDFTNIEVRVAAGPPGLRRLLLARARRP
jgi:SAM-dependent methyltransferase